MASVNPLFLSTTKTVTWSSKLFFKLLSQLLTKFSKYCFYCLLNKVEERRSKTHNQPFVLFLYNYLLACLFVYYCAVLLGGLTPIYFRVQLTSTLNTILTNDFPDNWPNFVSELERLLTSSDFRLVYVGLLALREVVKVYQ